MSANSWKSWLSVVVLGVYGGLLSIASIAAAGAGDGTYVLAVAVCAPCFFLSLLLSWVANSTAGVIAFVIGTTVWWMAVGSVMRTRTSEKIWRTVGAGLVLNYVLAIGAIAFLPFINLARFVESLNDSIGRTVLLGSLLLFVIGQIAVWRRWLQVNPHRQERKDPIASC